MKKSVFLVVVLGLCVFFIFLSYFFWFKKNENLIKAKIGEEEIQIEIADSPSEKIQGLSGRKNLGQNQGMLFVFDTPGNYSFWMKEMNFPLDFIWLSNRRVVEINENIQPADYQPPNSLIPKNQIDQVLEVKTGFVKKNNIKIGDELLY